MPSSLARVFVCSALAIGLTVFSGCASSDDTTQERYTYESRDIGSEDRTEPIPMAYAWGEDPDVRRTEVRRTEARTTEPRRSVTTDSGRSSASGRFAESGAVELEMHAPREVRAGQDFEYRINVINRADYPVHNVVVTEQLAQGFTVSQTNPEGRRSEGDRMRFEVGTLNAGETRVIRITGKASGQEQLVSCATVSYEPRICVVTNVVSPALTLRVSGPREVLLCENIPLVMEVSNTGSGTAMGVNIRSELPQGVVVAENSSNMINVTVGDLAAGQSRQFQVYLKPLDRGEYNFQPSARSQDGLNAQVEPGMTRVTEPVLTIKAAGPEQQFIGTDITYRLTVANTGDAGARDTIVQQQLPAGARFVNASDGGRAADGRIVWNLGTLPMNESRELSYTVQHSRPGQAQLTATASAYCARAVDATQQIAITGIPGVLLEVVDDSDPIQVGNNVTYVITVVNQGSAVDNNLRIQAELEDGMEFVSAEGPTQAQAQGNTIVFAPLAQLNPKERATWRMTVKATADGAKRFGLSLNTDQLGDRPVRETEATNFFR